MAYTTFNGPVRSINGFGDAANPQVFVGALVGTATQPVSTVAALGTNQATAAPLNSGVNNVTGANATVGVRLPVGTAGQSIRVKNVAAAVLPVYPATGGTINAIAANGALSLAASVPCTFVCTAANVWYSDPLLPS